MLDGIMGHDNFRSEIVWKRTGAHGSARRWGPIHDTILFYSKTSAYKWNRTFQPYSADYLNAHYTLQDERGKYQPVSLTGPGRSKGDSGRPWRGVDPTESGRHWAIPLAALRMAFPDSKNLDGLSTQERLDMMEDAGLIHWPERGRTPRQKRYADEGRGVPIQDVVTDINPAGGRERLGYATQKPSALIERILAASTDVGDVVMDPFCGCATTMEAAHNLERKWIGIDIAIHAIRRVAQVRLKDRLRLVEGQDFTVEGVPRSLEGAKDRWERDTYHFQKWAVEQVDGFVTAKRTADGGIDGRLYFDVPGERDLQSMVIEVKGGANVSIADLRALQGVLENEEAQMAGLIVMEPLGDRKKANFGSLAAQAGDLEVMGTSYPRMQVLSVQDIFEDRRFHTPSVVGRGSGQDSLPLMPSAAWPGSDVGGR